ncbi:unnamed protein product, partial [Brassica rapa subsp. trilocularis]
MPLKKKMAFFLLPALRRSSRLTISSQPPSTKRIIYSEVLKVRSGGVAEIHTEVVVSQ